MVAALRRTGPALYLPGEPLQRHECGRGDPTTYLLGGGLGIGVIPSAANLSTPEAVRRTGLGIMKADDLALPFPSCSTQETGPCTSPGQYTRAGADSKGTDELALVV